MVFYQTVWVYELMATLMADDRGYNDACLSFHIDIELLDPLQRQLLFLHQNTSGISHKLVRNVQDLWW